MKCNKCGSGKIKTRKNYSHGKKSRPVITRVCIACGSTDIQTQDPNQRWGKRRR